VAFLFALPFSGRTAGAAEGATRGYGPETGDWEVTLGGAGNLNEDSRSDSYGIAGSVGRYLDDHWLVGVRQSGTYSGSRGKFDRSSTRLLGSTRLFADWVLDWNRFRPSLGIALGATYGRGIPESFAIGPALNLRFYVDRKTFAFLGVEYDFLTSETDRWQDFIDNGNLISALGVGVNF